MTLSEICVKRPVFAWVLTLMVVLLGVVTGERLPIRQYPNAARNYITIKMDYQGVGPEIMEMQVTQNIEEAVAGVEGIDSVESVSDNGTSKVHLEINDQKDIESAMSDIRNQLDKWADKLPDDAQKPTFSKAGSGEKSIIVFALASKKKSDSDLYNFALNEISHSLESVAGVARVDVFGAGKYKMSLVLDPNRMAIHGLTALDVSSAIQRQNIQRPAGKIVNKDREYIVTTVADVQTPEEFDNIPIITKNKNIIKLKDVGKAKFGSDDDKVVSRFNGQKVVSISIIPQSSANPIQVARGVKAKFSEIQQQMPEDITFFTAYDTTTFIEKSLDEVYKTIFESIILVVLVVFVFLRSIKAAIIPLITVPISLVGALFIMYIFGFTINNMTLMSMVLAIGLVVDDAIVILENIYKYIERGFSPIKAAIAGTNEVNFAVIAMTLTLCAVYAPVSLAGGVTGRWIKEFSVTLAGAVVLSGFIALTLSPMMCSRMLGHAFTREQSETWWKVFQKKFDTSAILKRIDDKYAEMLKKVLNRRRSSVIFAVLFSLFGYTIFFFLPSEQIPYQDTGTVQFDGRAPQTSTLQYTQKYVDALDEIIGATPEVESRDYKITNPTFDGVFILKDNKKRTTDEIMEEIKQKYSAVAGVDARFISGTGGGGGDGDSSRSATFVVRGNKSQRELSEIAANLVKEIFAANFVLGVRSSANTEAESYAIEVLRDKASALNLEPITIARTVDSLFRGSVASKFKKDNKVYDVMVEIDDALKKTPEQLKDVYVKTTTEKHEEVLLPLTEVISVFSKSGPSSIMRYNRTRAYSISLALKPSCSLGEAIKIIQSVSRKTLPDDVFIDFIGETKRYMAESNTMLVIFLLAIGFIYLVMAAQFESWCDPFIIMLSVPLALVGGIVSLTCIKNGTINIFSNIGFLTLIGLITKHGILIVDFANKLVAQGKSHIEAIQEAASQRLRPIMMTTFAMILGSLPLAMANGAGREIRVPLGVVIVWGMAVGTLFTIFLVPVFYTYVSKLGKKKVAPQPVGC
jgi:multidrug efflux pump